MWGNWFRIEGRRWRASEWILYGVLMTRSEWRVWEAAGRLYVCVGEIVPVFDDFMVMLSIVGYRVE